jgi:hypothetical protein
MNTVSTTQCNSYGVPPITCLGKYQPPIGYYSQVECSIPKRMMHKLIGNKGHIFNAITKQSRVDYIWYDNDRHVIEIWVEATTNIHNRDHHKFCVNKMINAQNRLVAKMNSLST